MNSIKTGTMIKLLKKYYKHGQPGSAIMKDHWVIYGNPLLLRVYAIEHASVEYLDKQFRSKILRCRSEQGEPMNVICKIDRYELVPEPANL